jgi:hypothetical protein
MRSGLPIPNTAGDSIEEEVPQSVVLPLLYPKAWDYSRYEMERRFSRILEFFNLTRLYFGIAISPSYSKQTPSFRDNSIFPPPKADKGHGLFLAAVFLATRVS